MNILLVKRLRRKTTSEQLYAVFSRFGPVLKTSIFHMNRGYVMFQSAEDAHTALMKVKYVNAKPVQVCMAEKFIDEEEVVVAVGRRAEKGLFQVPTAIQQDMAGSSVPDFQASIKSKDSIINTCPSGETSSIEECGASQPVVGWLGLPGGTAVTGGITDRNKLVDKHMVLVLENTSDNTGGERTVRFDRLSPIETVRQAETTSSTSRIFGFIQVRRRRYQRTYAIETARVTFGRNSQCNIVLRGRKVSRCQCVLSILQSADACKGLLQVVGQRSSTWLYLKNNYGVKLTKDDKVQLQHGAIFYLADYHFQWREYRPHDAALKEGSPTLLRLSATGDLPLNSSKKYNRTSKSHVKSGVTSRQKTARRSKQRITSRAAKLCSVKCAIAKKYNSRIYMIRNAVNRSMRNTRWKHQAQLACRRFVIKERKPVIGSPGEFEWVPRTIRVGSGHVRGESACSGVRMSLEMHVQVGLGFDAENQEYSRRPDQLMEHNHSLVAEKTIIKRNYCKYCNLTCSTTSRLKRHRRTVSHLYVVDHLDEDWSLYCKMCHTVSKNIPSLVRHKQSSQHFRRCGKQTEVTESGIDEFTFGCIVCCTNYSDKYGLTRHCRTQILARKKDELLRARKDLKGEGLAKGL